MRETLIRAATSQDADAIVHLHRDFHAGHLAMDAARWTTRTPPVDVYRMWIEELIAGTGLVLVADRQGVEGYLIAEVEDESPRHWSPACVYLHDLYIAERARRGGVARRLANELIAWRDRLYPTLPIRLVTAAPNDAARTFFATLGFRAAAVEMIREG